MIIMPSKFIEAHPVVAGIAMEGWITLRAIRRSGLISREVSFKASDRSVGPFHNLYLDNGLDAFFQHAPNSAFLYRCSVGTGTTPPTVSDTALVTPVALVNPGAFANPANTSGFTPGTPGYGWQTYRWTSAIGGIGNYNLTEIGIGRLPTSGSTPIGTDLHVRELIRDGGGSPVAFPITSDEALEVTYELRLYHPNNDAAYTITISGASHDVIVRTIGAGSSPNSWGPLASNSNTNSSQVGTSPRAWTGDLAPKDRRADANANIGTFLGAGTASNVAYGTGNYYRDCTCTWGPAQGNGNVRTVVVNWATCSFQFQYDPIIAKVADKQLILPYRLSLARYP